MGARRLVYARNASTGGKKRSTASTGTPGACTQTQRATALGALSAVDDPIDPQRRQKSGTSQNHRRRSRAMRSPEHPPRCARQGVAELDSLGVDVRGHYAPQRCPQRRTKLQFRFGESLTADLPDSTHRAIRLATRASSRAGLASRARGL